MKVYEMIFNRGNDEILHSFYNENDCISRQHFIDFLHIELDQELEDFKNNCTSNDKQDLLILLEQINKENHHYINQLAPQFIDQAHSQLDPYISMYVEVHQYYDL